MSTPETLREKTYQVIFGTDTPAGRNFDLLLIGAILLSVFAIVLDSIEGPHLKYGATFLAVEWFFYPALYSGICNAPVVFA